MLERYNEFSERALLEKALCESTLYMSDKLSGRLREIGGKIADRLLQMSGSDIRPDATFLDLGEKDGEFTFVTMRNARKWLSGSYPDEFLDKVEKPQEQPKTWAKYVTGMVTRSLPEFWRQSRNPIRIGRLVNQIFPGEYSNAEVEKFVDNFKGAFSEGEEFVMVRGEEIAAWYRRDKCDEVKGKLGDSCMLDKDPSLFKIYADNPETCSLLLLVSKESGRALGRALVWKIGKIACRKACDAEFFLDRQYTIKDADVNKFRNYAREKGWAFRTYNGHDKPNCVTYKGEDILADMTVAVKPGKYAKYPYMDTFKRYDHKKGELHNDENMDFIGDYILTSTEGMHSEIGGRVYSSWNDNYIDQENAVWSDGCDSYLDRRACWKVTLGRRSGWYPQDYPEIVKNAYDGYIHVEDCVFSELRGEYVYELFAVPVIVGTEPKIKMDFVHGIDANRSSDIQKLETGGSVSDWFGEKLADVEKSDAFVQNEAYLKFREDVKRGMVNKVYALTVLKMGGEDYL